MKRRTRSAHPGVVLIPPDSDASARRVTWRARYRDPASGRLVKVRLDPKVLPTAADRRRWAVGKSKALALASAREASTLATFGDEQHSSGVDLGWRQAAIWLEEYVVAHPRASAWEIAHAFRERVGGTASTAEGPSNTGT